jgi:ribonucleoside-diphosphate reductase alpha chain
MNTANWIPDLFMKRVMENTEWTLFSPRMRRNCTTRSAGFEEAYLRYEDKSRGERAVQKAACGTPVAEDAVDAVRDRASVDHVQDPCNLQPQQHVGVVHSSNLCTEITLNTSDEIAVCNRLGEPGCTPDEGRRHTALDFDKLHKTIRTAMRMLDNVIDINYAVDKARHRTSATAGRRASWASRTACKLRSLRLQSCRFRRPSMEMALLHLLGLDRAGRGAGLPTFGLALGCGILPQDARHWLPSARLRGLDRSSALDWEPLRAHPQHGMRNSNCIAIAPTATIANIIGVSASLEPTYQNLYVKSNCRASSRWSTSTWSDLSAPAVGRSHDLRPEVFRRQPRAHRPRAGQLRRLYAAAFEIEQSGWWRRARGAKWIDQSQSLNIYMAGASGKKLDETYKLAWIRGLKTTYYLRAMGATHAEKSQQGGSLECGSIRRRHAGCGLPRRRPGVDRGTQVLPMLSARMPR